MSSKEISYSPTSYFFDEKIWLREISGSIKCNPEYILSGKIIGNSLREIDESFRYLKNKFGDYSEEDILDFQESYTIDLFRAIQNLGNNKVKIDKIESFIEDISDGTKLLLKTANSKIRNYKDKNTYEHFLALAQKRLYLEENWKKIENRRLKLKHTDKGFLFISRNSEIDFGEAISPTRFKDHLLQISSQEHENSSFQINELISIPSEVKIVNNKIKLVLSKPNKTDNIFISTLISQIEFHYKKLLNIGFKNFPNIKIFDLIIFWIIFTKLAKKYLEYKTNNIKDIKSYNCFSESELVEILSNCSRMGLEKSKQIIKLFSNSKSSSIDLYIKPIYKIDNKFFICLPTLVSSQFTRIVDFYVDREISPKTNKIKKLQKGILFENEFSNLIKKQIDKNKLINNSFCEVVKVNFNEKGGDNQEIDIIIRIGETYLIIESKSAGYRTGNVNHHNFYNRILKSKLKEKRDFFLKDYKNFREKFDKNSNFELKEKNVICCYLTSIPNCVGTKINNYPVVDSHILERYFGNGNYILSNKNGEHKKFPFYKTPKEAEDNLFRYLNSPPQLEIYRRTFKKELINSDIYYENFKIYFNKSYFDLSYENEKIVSEHSWLEADTWHTKKL